MHGEGADGLLNSSYRATVPHSSSLARASMDRTNGNWFLSRASTHATVTPSAACAAVADVRMLARESSTAVTVAGGAITPNEDALNPLRMSRLAEIWAAVWVKAVALMGRPSRKRDFWIAASMSSAQRREGRSDKQIGYPARCGRKHTR